MLDEILLQKLAKWRPDPANPTLHLSDDEGRWGVSLEANAVDTIGAQLRQVSVWPVTATVAAPLREQAEALAGRVTGLLEPLRVVEIDDGRAVAQLRSTTPAERDGTRRYYEVERNVNGATKLHRYQTGAGQAKREAIPFNLTHEALAKIVRDFIG